MRWICLYIGSLTFLASIVAVYVVGGAITHPVALSDRDAHRTIAVARSSRDINRWFEAQTRDRVRVTTHAERRMIGDQFYDGWLRVRFDERVSDVELRVGINTSSTPARLFEAGTIEAVGGSDVDVPVLDLARSTINSWLSEIDSEIRRYAGAALNPSGYGVFEDRITFFAEATGIDGQMQPRSAQM